MSIKQYERVRVLPMQRYSGVWGRVIEPPNAHGICVVELDNGITEKFHISDIAGSDIIKYKAHQEVDTPDMIEYYFKKLSEDIDKHSAISKNIWTTRLYKCYYYIDTGDPRNPIPYIIDAEVAEFLTFVFNNRKKILEILKK